MNCTKSRAVHLAKLIIYKKGYLPDRDKKEIERFAFNTKNRKSFELNEQNYKNLVIILNRLIAHLNQNRQKNGLSEVSLIPEAQFDDLVDMKSKGKSPQDYMDTDVYTYWQTYVIDQLDSYFEENSTPA